MKKLLILIFCIFTSFNLFAEEFTLFPWFCTQRDIYDYCISKGWKYTTDNTLTVPAFDFIPTEDVTYHSQPIYTINFMFDETGKVVSQTISFNNLVKPVIIFASILDNAVNDKARLIEKSISEYKGYDRIIVKGTLNDKTDVEYIAYGSDDSYQISISYHIY